MIIEIKNRRNDSVIYKGEHPDMVSAVTHCVANKISLRYADLRYADLGSANLRYANLGYADLGYANLGSADLRYADLYGYYSFGPCGSRQSYTWARWEDSGYIVHCGCQDLPLADFKKRVIETHGKNYHAKVYLAQVKVMELIAKESEKAFREYQEKVKKEVSK